MTFGFDYDYNSIMHYDAYAFTKSNDKPTILPTDPTRSYTSIGRLEKPTDSDYFKLNALYECSMIFFILFFSNIITLCVSLYMSNTLET